MGRGGALMIPDPKDVKKSQGRSVSGFAMVIIESSTLFRMMS